MNFGCGAVILVGMLDPQSPPGRFGRYEVTAEIGGGAMGRVYRGWDPLVRRAVAIKTLKRERLLPTETAEALRRFQREAQAAGALSHAHIVNVFDVGEDYIVMELLDGASLDALLAERGRLTPGEVLGVLAPVADALEHAHAAGVIHRDIKPGNIMVLPDGRPKLTDFGLARLDSALATRPGEVFGSPSYMAPEQVAGETATPRVDVYALAVVAFECLTGRKPFEGASVAGIVYRVLHEAAPSPRALQPELPQHVDDVFARALAKQPAQRQATPSVFVAELRESLGAAAAVPLHVARSAQVTPPPAAVFGAATLGYDEAPEVARTPHAPAPAGTPAPPTRATRGRLALAAALLVVVALGLSRLAARPSPSAPGPAAFQRLRVISTPDGATVVVDERELGRTPLELDLSTGAHTVRVARPGFAPAQLGVETRPDAPLPPLRFVLQPLTASLSVTSRPSGATVRVGGEVVGRTPLEKLALPPGVHQVSVERAGYTRVTRVVAADAGENPVLDVTLVPGVRPTPAPKTSAGDLVRADDAGVVAPRRVRGEAAALPQAARAAGLHGSVLVALIVDEQGVPTRLHVLESAGDLLDQAVLEAMRDWRYEPARKDGVAVKYPLQHRQTFAPR